MCILSPRLAIVERHDAESIERMAHMDSGNCEDGLFFRVWIVHYDNWRPRAWDELPPRATAVEPADAAAMSAREAVRFLEGFNRTMLGQIRVDPDARVWSVAVPVTILYEGDLHVGAIVARGRTKLLDCNAREYAAVRERVGTELRSLAEWLGCLGRQSVHCSCRSTGRLRLPVAHFFSANFSEANGRTTSWRVPGARG